MKNMNNKIDPLAEVKNSKNFQKYSQEAKEKIKLGVEIYNTRENLKISQQELAKKAETTQKVISRIENGDVNIGFSLLNRIADVLGFNHEHWGRIFNFSIPYNVFFVGEKTDNTMRVREKISSPKKNTSTLTLNN